MAFSKAEIFRLHVIELFASPLLQLKWVGVTQGQRVATLGLTRPGEVIPTGYHKCQNDRMLFTIENVWVRNP